MRRSILPIAVAVMATVISGSARAADADGDAARAQNEVSQVDRESASVQSAVERARGQRYSVEQCLANAELLYRTKDYARASVVFSEILEEYPGTPSYPDALWLRGETFFATKEYLSARRDYRQLVDHGRESRFVPYYGKALARLVDVSLRLNDIKGLDEVFAKMNEIPPAQVDAALSYAKGKAYYFKGDFGNAGSSLQAVPNTAQHAHQARYFQGLVAMKQATGGRPASADGSQRAVPPNYKQAIEAFKALTDLPPDSPEHRHVIDLGWMAIGRLHYEMENYTSASEAYSKVGRDSPEFGTMLYELAWVYVRLGDVQRAERALEVLQIADPSSPLVGDGTLLRADLLLRAGAFDKSLQLYTGVRDEFDPMRARVEAFIDSTQDPAVYYQKLSEQQLDLLDPGQQLPPLAIRWAREAEDGPMAFAVIDDVNQCKTLIRQSYSLIEKLNVIMNASSRVRAFPDLLAGEERALSLLNRIGRMRLSLARGLDDEEPRELSGEIASVREQRRQAMGIVKDLPVSSGEFAKRDVAGLKQWNHVSQGLTRRNVEIDNLQATINGLRRMLKEDAQRGVTRDPATLARFETELAANEQILKDSRAKAADLRRMIEVGRVQVGIGDARYQADGAARAQLRDALDREVQLAATGAAGSGAQRYAGRIQPALQQARVVEDRLIAAFAQLEQQVAAKIGEVQAKVEAERVKIDQYNVQLGALDAEARDLVGQVARRNFVFVRDRLRSIVLRADVGITEQAWEVREEELERVHNLQTERAREEQLLDEELREVLDDAGEKPATPAK